MLQQLERFFNDASGAVTLDWVVLTLSIFGLYGVFGFNAAEMTSGMLMVDISLPAEFEVSRFAASVDTHGLTSLEY